MNKLLGVLVAAAFIGTAGIASAEEATGTVEGVDLQSRMIVLDDGTVFAVSEGIALETLRPGSEVTVSYEETDGQKLVNNLTIERE